MNDRQKIIEFLGLLLEDIDKIRNICALTPTDINLISKLDSLEGKIEGAKMALEWTEERKEEK